MCLWGFSWIWQFSFLKEVSTSDGAEQDAVFETCWSVTQRNSTLYLICAFLDFKESEQSRMSEANL